MKTSIFLRLQFVFVSMSVAALILTGCGSSYPTTTESPISDKPSASSQVAANLDAQAKEAAPKSSSKNVAPAVDKSAQPAMPAVTAVSQASGGLFKPVTLRIDAGHSSIPTCGPVTSEFGPRNGAMHTGIDIKAVINSPIYCAFDGKVVMAKSQGDYGNMVVVRHANGMETLYAHLNSIVVALDQTVKGGEVLGTAGKTGNATAVHLHFETRYGGKSFNPRMVFDFDNCNLLTSSLTLDEMSFRRYGADLTLGEDQANYARSSTALPETGTSSGEVPSRQVQTVPSVPRNTYPQQTYPQQSTNQSVNMQPTYAQPTKTQPVKTQPAGTVPDQGNLHMVVKGDTLYSLARRYGTTVEELKRLNGIGDDNKIKEGYWIRVR